MLKHFLLSLLLIIFCQVSQAQSIFNILVGDKKETTQNDCVQLKTSKNPPNRSYNVVFVPSGYNGQMEEFESFVRSQWKNSISKFEPFSKKVDTMNVWIAKIPHSSNSYCSFSSRNDRVLKCNGNKARWAASHCGKGKQDVIVIENTTRHGGSGKPVASSSATEYAGSQVVHELGHSMFNLSDEYTLDDASIPGKNCASVSSTCEKWQDLIDAGLATCQRGCRGNDKLTSSNSIMRELHMDSFGHVNSRLICCKFKKVTGEYPYFCDQYRHIGVGLDRFCR